MSCGITAIGQYGVEKRALIIKIGGLLYNHALQSDTTLNEERMQEVILRYREICAIQICPVCLGQFTSNIEFYICVYVRVIIGGY